MHQFGLEKKTTTSKSAAFHLEIFKYYILGIKMGGTVS